jgi:hypothetical protein
MDLSPDRRGSDEKHSLIRYRREAQLVGSALQLHAITPTLLHPPITPAYYTHARG